LSDKKITGFFLDTCILLPQAIEADKNACEKILSSDVDYFVSKSVRDEAAQLSNNAYNVLSTGLRHYIKPAFERKGVRRVMRNEATDVAEVFSQEKRRIDKDYPVGRTNIRRNMFGQIENYVASLMHNLDVDKHLSVTDLLAATLITLENARHEVEKPFKTICTVPVEANEKLVTFEPICKLVKNDRDVRHLMAAVQYQFKFDTWVIFVTNDEKDILSNAEEIWRFCGLRCVKPCWAFDYRRDMTRFNRPRQYFGEDCILSKELRAFIKIIESVLQVSIRSDVFEQNK